MALADGRSSAIAAFENAWVNTNSQDITAAAMVDAIIALVQNAGVNVPGAGIESPNGPCTGESTTGSLS